MPRKAVATNEVSTSIDGLAVGKLVRFVTEAGKVRPAIIVAVWDHGTGCSNLQVFTDGTNDGVHGDQGTQWVTSILYSEDEQPCTWHFAE